MVTQSFFFSSVQRCDMWNLASTMCPDAKRYEKVNIHQNITVNDDQTVSMLTSMHCKDTPQQKLLYIKNFIVVRYEFFITLWLKF